MMMIIVVLLLLFLLSDQRWMVSGMYLVSVKVELLDHINSHLYSAVLACRAAKEQQNATKSTFPVPSEKIPSNKTTEHQWRFNQTTKNPGRKKQGIILN